MFEDVGVVAGVEGVTVIHGSSWQAAQFNKTAGLWLTAHALPDSQAINSRQKKPRLSRYKTGVEANA
jgi:hypothetical protein